MWTSCFSDKTQAVVSKLFYMYGVTAFRHPFLFIILGLGISALSFLGFNNYTYENRASYLWVPESSDVFQNYLSTIEHFGEIEPEMVMVIHNTKGNNLLTPTSMDIIYSIFNQAMNITYFAENKLWTFDDLCARKYDGYQECISREEGLFSFFEFNPTNWATQESIQSTIDHYISILEIYVGGYLYDENDDNTVIGGDYVRLVLTLAGHSNDTLVEIVETYQNEWENYWKEHSLDYEDEYDIEILFVTDNSFGPEIDRVVNGDTPILGAAFLVMLIYLACTLGPCNCVEARPFVALGSLISTICAIVTGMGAASGFGVEFNAIVLLSPFVLLGVAVDDDIIIVESLNRTNKHDKIEKRFGKAMEHAGVSITLTSFSSIVAFAIGSTVDLAAIYSFCIVAALSFFANYISQLLIFVPILSLDERRIISNRNCCICCHIHSRDRTPSPPPKETTSPNGEATETSTTTTTTTTTELPPTHATRAPSRSVTTTFTTENQRPQHIHARQLKSISMMSEEHNHNPASPTSPLHAVDETEAQPVTKTSINEMKSFDLNPAFATVTIIKKPKPKAKLAANSMSSNAGNNDNNIDNNNTLNPTTIDGAETDHSDTEQTISERDRHGTPELKTIQPTGSTDTLDKLDIDTSETDKNADSTENTNNNAQTDTKERIIVAAEREQSQGCCSKISMEYFLIECLVPYLSQRWFRMLIILIFTTVLSVSIWALQFVSTDSDATKLVPDDSFIIDIYDALDDGFGDITIGPVEIVIENRDFSDKQTRDDVLNMIYVFENEFESNNGMFVGNISHWMNDFNKWIINQYNFTSVDDVGDMYYTLLKEFTNITEYKQWDKLIIYDNNDMPTKIIATKFGVTAEYALNLNKRWEWYKEMQKSFDNSLESKNSGYLFVISFLFSYFSTIIVGLTIENLTFAIIGVFIVLIMLVDIRMSLFIVMIIMMIDIELVGWMVIYDITLDYISYVELVMAVGLTVDYIVHVTHAITHAKGIKEPNSLKEYTESYQERLTIAFKDMGVGVAKGALTTFLGTMTLAFSQSEAFRVFFLMLCGIVLISALHGFLLIPSLLAELPFIYSNKCKY